MNKMLLILIAATFPIGAVNAQVQVVPPAMGTSSGQPITPQGSPTVNKSDPRWRSGRGHGASSASVAAPGSAHTTDPKSSGAAPQGNRPGNSQ